MKTVGSILKSTRLAKGYTLEAVEQATKVRVKFLEAIENDDFQILPSASYAKGFVKNYSEFLGLDSANVLAFFRRQTREIPKTSLLPAGLPQPLNRPLFALTPGRFLTLLLISLLVMFLLYFGLQYRRLRQPPILILETPQPLAVTGEKRIDVSGKTDPDATLTINGRSILVRSDGSFFDQLALEAGVNKVTIIATSRFGKTTTKVVEVGLQQP
jgi:cytoskeletal protein RodZ